MADDLTQKEKPVEEQEFSFTQLRQIFQNMGMKVIKGAFQSLNFVTLVSGWRMSNTSAEFNVGSFSIAGTTITIDNTEDIQTNLDNISTAGGGTLYLRPGTYTLTADITVPAGVVLEGVSRDGVILDCASSYAVKITGSNTYSTGTVTIANGATGVVGSGTTFTSGMVGRHILLQDAWYEITAFTDTTHITIGSAYAGSDLTTATYVLATVNFNGSINKVTVTGATGSGIVCSYAMEINLDDVVVYGCGTGIDMDYVVFPRVRATSAENGVNVNFNYVFGFFIDYAEFSLSTTGAGVIMTNSENATFFNSSVNDNFADGINLTSCNTIAFISFDISGNGGQGVEMVSDCNDNQFAEGLISQNASDGIKMTATSDRNTLVAISMTDNGGYAINISASTCDNNQIIAPAFENNTSGNINDQGTNTFISPESSASYTGGHAITAGNAVYLSNGSTGAKSVITSNTNTSDTTFGQVSSGPSKLAQSVTPSTKVYCGAIQIQMAQFSATIDQIEVALQADSAGVPSGTDLAVTGGQTIAGGADALYTFTFGSIQTLSASTKYWFVIRRTGSADDTNYYAVRKGASGYAGGSLFKYETATWSDLSTDAYFNVREVLPSGYIGVAQADISGRYQNFIGFATKTIAIDASTPVKISGEFGGLSGLTIGPIYLSDTPGAVSSSAGTNTRKVGIALSATKLLLTNIW